MERDMAEGGSDGLVIRLRDNFDAAVRHREAARKHPEARHGLMRAALLYQARAATLARDICSDADFAGLASEARSASK
jgi:hypothetical protein